MTQIVCLLGNPRAEGNSAELAQLFCKSAEAEGAAITSFDLPSLRYSGCRTLFHCKTAGERCGLDDDLSAVLEAVRAANIVVLASPVYFTDVSSDLKACIDRLVLLLRAGLRDQPAEESAGPRQAAGLHPDPGRA